ncbi:DUF6397 family protein [Streptomyces sp. HNM0574]|uniref:DUF6397 family protein n=1 Tax=Streptomyces sp. HNM0574 TaxID=2714954 RepID=UPI00146C4E0A|nr:DUF6397 family protein [Streptomyces sp. HNM0574]NLU68740.1 hypothetical protein [Streptomyces sp. HNM0574]
MGKNVAMARAARELGLKPKELELAVREGEVHTVPGREGEARRVMPRAELDRLKQIPGRADGLRERVRTVTTKGGAELLGIAPARFLRLARGGCFSPARFYVNRYGSTVWLYLVSELREFAARRPELLSGRTPTGLRVLLAEGADYRAREWRNRRVGQLVREAVGPWERAAARAAVLDDEALQQAVPVAEERVRLLSLRPPLVTVPEGAEPTRRAAAVICRASEEDEIFCSRLLLTAELEEARAADLAGTAFDPFTPLTTSVPGMNGESGPEPAGTGAGTRSRTATGGPATEARPVDGRTRSSAHRPRRRARRWYDRLRGARRAAAAGNGPAARLARLSRSTP